MRSKMSGFRMYGGSRERRNGRAIRGDEKQQSEELYGGSWEPRSGRAIRGDEKQQSEEMYGGLRERRSGIVCFDGQVVTKRRFLILWTQFLLLFLPVGKK